MFKFCTYTFLTVLTVDLLATSGDITLTWTSPVLPKLYSKNPDINPLGQPSKICLLGLAVTYIISFLILALVQNLYWYYCARILAGISAGGACSVLPLYIAEIAEDSNRGMLSVTLNIFWTFGNLIPYVLGPRVRILPFNLILACVPTLFFILFFTIAPESPYFLVGKNKIDKAEDSLMKLRTRRRSAVGKELLNIQDSLKFDEKQGSFFDLFKTKSNLRALIISLTLITFQQLSGINAVLFYTQLIFQTSGSTLPPEISSIIIGVVLFLSSLITPFFADNLGRRVFLMVSSLGMMVSLVILGTYFFYKELLQDDLRRVPILTLVSFTVSFNLCFGSLPWTVSSELFSVNVKPIGSALVSLTCWLDSFVITKFFNDINVLLGQAGTFWLFGGFCFVSTLFTLFYVPETRRKSFIEIQEILGK